MAKDGHALVAMADRIRPDLIIAGIEIPLLNGIDALRQIHQKDGTMKIIFLTRLPNISLAVEALKAGARGYLVKTSLSAEILEAIHEVLNGRVYVSESIAESVRGALFRPRGPHRSANSLTIRQEQVLRLLAQGLRSKEIAQRMSISLKTVEYHKQQIKDVLGLGSIAELVRYAAEHGIAA